MDCSGRLDAERSSQALGQLASTQGFRAWSQRLDLSKQERIREFLRRMNIAPAASSFNEAYTLLCVTLNEVEDELTSIPNHPEHWQTDGRLYPPQFDSRRDVPGRDDVKRFRSRGHNTYVAENGAIEIQEIPSKKVVLTKNGASGRNVWESREDDPAGQYNEQTTDEESDSDA